VRSIVASLPFAGLTVLCWGSYGQVLHHSKASMGNSSMAQLLCVGLAYFLIAVIIPVFVLRTKGENGNWSKDGFLFGLAAGTFGALGALGIITALTSGGDPIYVMPIVFGGAPVVNTLVAMWIGKLFGKASNGFYLGIILVAMGAAGVFITKPKPAVSHDATPAAQKQVEGAEVGEKSPEKSISLITVMAGIALTVVCWGSYGTVLHKSQAKMGGSRLRPLFCVGLAYFLIAVIVPLLILSRTGAPEWNYAGAFGSLAAGACGAIGALGIILSFTFGGKPIFVMPIVFGGAPIINTMISVIEKGTEEGIPALFVASLTIVIIGAIATLVCAPRPTPGKPQADDGEADSPPPVDDQAPATEDDAPVNTTEDAEAEDTGPGEVEGAEEEEDEPETEAAEPVQDTGQQDEEAKVDDSAFEKDVEDIGIAVSETLDELKSILDDSTDNPDPAGDDSDADEEADQEEQRDDS
jgi:hypothetical protein